jgi:site-specific DNA-methyltransferase (adenine-specific)
MGRDEFMRNTLSVWEFPTESARKIGHPAPFPEELPRRLIELYTYEDDLVLDPFCGAGTTCVAAERLGRKWVGYDINEDYLKIARRRMEDATPSLWAGRKGNG